VEPHPLVEPLHTHLAAGPLRHLLEGAINLLAVKGGGQSDQLLLPLVSIGRRVESNRLTSVKEQLPSA